MSASSAPVVRVQLQLQSRDGHPKEIVRQETTKGNDVVEVDGFTFIGKRPRNEALAQTEAQNAQQTSLACEAYEGSDQQMQEQAVGTEGANPEPSTPLHAVLSPQPTAAPGVDVLQTPPSEQPSASPSAVMPAYSPQQPAALPAPPPIDLTAEVSRLKGFLPKGCPASVSVRWLLERALSLAVSQEPATAELGAPTSAADVAAAILEKFDQGLQQRVNEAQQLLHGDVESLVAFDTQPPLIREQCVSSHMAARLRQQLAALEAEEHAWEELLARYKGLSQDGSELADEGEEKRFSAGAVLLLGSSATAEGGDEGVQEAQAERLAASVDMQGLVALQQRTDMQLGFQVEALQSMLDKADHLVEQAQSACALMQADYHRDNFHVYAHVNSPQVLVKMLSQAQGPGMSQRPGAGTGNVGVAADDCVPATQPSQQG